MHKSSRRWAAAAAVAALLASCGEPTAPPRSPQQPEFSAAHPDYDSFLFSPGPHVHIMPARGARGLGGGGGTGIFYHGGPIIQSTRISAIYWSGATIYAGGPAPGSSGSGSSDGSLVGLFMRSLGGTPYFNINTTYYDGSGTSVSNTLAYAQFWADNASAPSAGATVSDAAVQQEVIRALSSGALAYNASTLYAVFSANGVNLGGGFGSSYCAYHGHFTWNGNDVKYAVMPYDAEYPSGCTAGSGISPTSDFPAAAEVNTLAHETEETATDEDLNAWYDRRGEENADKCAWKFGTTSSSSTGTYNQQIGGVNWLIQMNWVNSGSGGCLQHWP